VESEGAYAMPEGIEIESKIAQMEGSNMENVEKLGSLSAFTCPECHGTLWELEYRKNKRHFLLIRKVLLGE
jgi:hypothetical protein